MHCVLNKADQLDTESLMRVYGALLWSMGRIFKGAEVSRIYVGSFRDEPLMRDEHATLFHKDELVLKGCVFTFVCLYSCLSVCSFCPVLFRCSLLFACLSRAVLFHCSLLFARWYAHIMIVHLSHSLTGSGTYHHHHYHHHHHQHHQLTISRSARL